MKKRFLASVLVLLALFGCNLPQNSTPEPASTSTQPPPATIAPEQATATIAAVETEVITEPSQHFNLTTWRPLMELGSYDQSTYNQPFNTLPISLQDVVNPEVIEGLTNDQLDFFKENGFVIITSNDLQFSDVRDRVALKNGQAFFLTTDNAFHALHVAFNDLLEAVEKQALRPIMMKMISALYAKIDTYIQANQDPNLDRDLQLSKNYLAVAMKLFEPSISLDPQVEDAIAPQLGQIAAMEGKAESALIPGLTDDYGSYRPVGHYAGVPELESYFQGMTWLGRVAFTFPNPVDSTIQPTRTPLIITLALREAEVDGVSAEDLWLQVYEITNFMIGPSDDPGPIEINHLMEQIYGADVTIAALADEETWIEFLSSTRSNCLPPRSIPPSRTPHLKWNSSVTGDLWDSVLRLTR